jgi:hypothetical protein
MARTCTAKGQQNAKSHIHKRSKDASMLDNTQVSRLWTGCAAFGHQAALSTNAGVLPLHCSTLIGKPGQATDRGDVATNNCYRMIQAKLTAGKEAVVPAIIDVVPHSQSISCISRPAARDPQTPAAWRDTRASDDHAACLQTPKHHQMMPF